MDQGVGVVVALQRASRLQVLKLLLHAIGRGVNVRGSASPGHQLQQLGCQDVPVNAALGDCLKFGLDRRD